MNNELAGLAENYWDTLMEAYPTAASLIGDHRFDDRMEDFSREAEERLAGALHDIASGAAAIDPDSLDETERVTRAVLAEEAAAIADFVDARLAEFLVDPMLGPQIDLVQSIPQLSPQTPAHAGALVAKAAAVTPHLDQAVERLRQGLAAGRTPVATLVRKTLDQLDEMLARPIEETPFLQVQAPPSMDETATWRWRDDLARQTTDAVNPALARYRDFIRDEVLPAARPDDKAGLCWLPDGEAVYAAARRRFTSLDVDPDAVHQSGLDDIAALEDEYRELAAEVLGTSDVAEIYDRLRNDPELRFRTADEVQEAAEQALARANEAVPDWFGRLPQAPCLIQPIPDVGAEDAPLAYYLQPATDGSRPGIFFINLTEPETRTRYESEALAFHESVPGHHFQLAIAQELEDLPTFRRHGIQTAYVEGWGLYTERLADEMGLYSSGVARFGILSFDSWRAGRLVVDTGLHAKGWSRQQAVDYFTANSPQAPNNIANEVDRYIGYQGQALAYKLGQRAIFEARAAARRKLGAAFDIKAFHDTVLGAGALPLRVLAEVVDRWADGQAA